MPKTIEFSTDILGILEGFSCRDVFSDETFLVSDNQLSLSLPQNGSCLLEVALDERS